MSNGPWMYQHYLVGERAIDKGEYWRPVLQDPKEVEVIRIKKNRLGRISYVVRYQNGSEKELLFERLEKKVSKEKTILESSDTNTLDAIAKL